MLLVWGDGCSLSMTGLPVCVAFIEVSWWVKRPPATVAQPLYLFGKQSQMSLINQPFSQIVSISNPSVVTALAAVSMCLETMFFWYLN